MKNDDQTLSRREFSRLAIGTTVTTGARGSRGSATADRTCSSCPTKYQWAYWGGTAFFEGAYDRTVENNPLKRGVFSTQIPT